MRTSKVGGALRSSTVFCVRRRRASSSLERHRVDAADEVGQRRIGDEVVETDAVRRGDELHAALGDGARRQRLRLGADLVDDHDLGHVVLDGFDHDGMLPLRRRHLHAPGAADAGVRNVAVAGDLIRGVDDHHAPVEIVGQDARRLAQQGRLADARASQQQHAAAGFDHVAHDLDGAVDGAAHAAGEPDDLAQPIAQCRDPVQRALDPGPVVFRERADPGRHVVEVLARHRISTQLDRAPWEARLRLAAEVEHHFQQRREVVQRLDFIPHARRQHHEQQIEVVGDLYPRGVTGRLHSSTCCYSSAGCKPLPLRRSPPAGPVAAAAGPPI